MTLSEKIFGSSIGAFVLYAKSKVDGALVAVTVDPTTGALQVDTEISATLDPTGLATKAAAGVSTDAPASVSVDEDGTARTHTSLLKGAKNLLIDISGYLSTLAGAVTSSKVQVDIKSTVSTAVTGPLTSTELISDIGALTDAPASVSADEDGTARSIISLLKGAKNLLIDISGFLAALKFGDQNKAASLSVTPATDITRGRYIGAIEDIQIDIGSPVRITNDTSSKSVAVPATAKAFACQAEGGDVRLEINEAASTTSTIRVPEDSWLPYPIVGGTQTLYSYGAVGTYSNVRFLG